MIIPAILILGGLVFLTGSAILAFAWAARSGQFRELEKAAEVIFDEEEPVGMPTDRFPRKNSR
ncbi:MAG: cbb3-type cytochrome oxidase assembly protein CcoS [Terrimicrobiaceae bacterium]|nr:cbb3-type cytochrome oxidase assembly protein CcoS [Terrimicrobiaceae bacterium]